MEKTSTQLLVEALEAENDPRLAGIIVRARAHFYNDFKSELMNPIGTLVADLRGLGHEALAQRAINGDFDATKAETDAWGRSPEAVAIFQEMAGTKTQKRDKPKGFG